MRPERLDIDPHALDAGRVFRYWLRSFELFLEALRDERQAEVGCVKLKRQAEAEDVFGYFVQ